VAIPDCLQGYNNKHALRDKRAGMMYALFVGGAFSGTPALASLCTECGTCLPRCPQNVPIPEILKEVAADFEGPLFPAQVWFLRRMLAFGRWRAKRATARAERSDGRSA
jgi:predicted aldo/keto reductase-like oxidoreductase